MSVDQQQQDDMSQFNQQSKSPYPLVGTSASSLLLAGPSDSRAIVDQGIRRRMCPRIIQSKEGTMLAIDEVVRTRWRIMGLIGCGGYGQIFVAHDQQTNESVAIKAEPTRRKNKLVRRMILEQRVLVRLQGQPHVPIIYASGCERDINFIVMQILSINLGDLRKQCPLQRLSKSTTSRIAQQAIAGLRDLHNANFLHRDIKPANLCFGITEASKHRLFIVDYGLVRCYRSSDGKTRPQRKKAGFRGTLRYVSVRVHDRQEQGPSDDLVSLFYTIIELLTSELPWKKIPSTRDIRAAKEQIKNDDFHQLSEIFGPEIREFGHAVLNMRYDDEPNYQALQDIMKTFGSNVPLDAAYDWMEDFSVVMHDEEEINRKLKLIF